MTKDAPIKGIEELAKQANVQKIGKEPGSANKDKFDALMAKDMAGKEVAQTEQIDKKANLEEVVRTKQNIGPLEEVNKQSILNRTKTTLSTIDEIKSKLKQQLSTDQLTIKKSYQPQLRNKLTHVEDSLRIALMKAGAEAVEAEASPAASVNPVERFLGHLSHAQNQLESLGSYVEAMQNAEAELSPASMLAIQIKVHHVQQELEFFSNLLNKALESTKTILNIQV